MDDALEPGSRPTATLRDAEHLAPVDGDLTGTDGREAGHPGEVAVAHAATVHHGVAAHGTTGEAERLTEHLTHPPRCTPDVAVGERVLRTDDEIDPHVITGTQQHGSPTGTPPGDVHSRLRRRHDVDVRHALRAAQHDRGCHHLLDDDRSALDRFGRGEVVQLLCGSPPVLDPPPLIHTTESRPLPARQRRARTGGYAGHMTPTPGPRRRAARVLVFDPQDRVLLIEGRDPAGRTPGGWWEIPGGGVDHGEDIETAVRRELWEEAGIRDADIGPCVWTQQVSYTFGGWLFEQDEWIHVARCDGTSAGPGGLEHLEAMAFGEQRWWAVEDVLTHQPRTIPYRMVEFLEDVAGGRWPEAPVDISPSAHHVDAWRSLG